MVHSGTNYLEPSLTDVLGNAPTSLLALKVYEKLSFKHTPSLTRSIFLKSTLFHTKNGAGVYAKGYDLFKFVSDVKSIYLMQLFYY